MLRSVAWLSGCALGLIACGELSPTNGGGELPFATASLAGTWQLQHFPLEHDCPDQGDLFATAPGPVKMAVRDGSLVLQQDAIHLQYASAREAVYKQQHTFSEQGCVAQVDTTWRVHGVLPAAFSATYEVDVYPVSGCEGVQVEACRAVYRATGVRLR